MKIEPKYNFFLPNFDSKFSIHIRLVQMYLITIQKGIAHNLKLHIEHHAQVAMVMNQGAFGDTS